MRIGKMKKLKETTPGCDTVTALLSRYQDNELDREMQVRISSHLGGCDACRKKLESLEQVAYQVKHLPEVDTAVNFTAVVMGKILERQEEKTQRFRLPSFSFAYSLIFILFLILGFWFSSMVDNSSGGSPQDQPEIYIAQLLTESQNLRLINVQENAMALLDTGSGNGK